MRKRRSIYKNIISIFLSLIMTLSVVDISSLSFNVYATDAVAVDNLNYAKIGVGNVSTVYVACNDEGKTLHTNPLPIRYYANTDTRSLSDVSGTLTIYQDCKPYQVEDNPDYGNDIIFVVDISGTMGNKAGNGKLKWVETYKALSYLLENDPDGRLKGILGTKGKMYFLAFPQSGYLEGKYGIRILAEGKPGINDNTSFAPNEYNAEQHKTLTTVADGKYANLKSNMKDIRDPQIKGFSNLSYCIAFEDFEGKYETLINSIKSHGTKSTSRNGKECYFIKSNTSNTMYYVFPGDTTPMFLGIQTQGEFDLNDFEFKFFD